MAPTKRARAQAKVPATTKSSKKAKPSPDAATKSKTTKRPAKLARPPTPKKIISDQPVYSPNIDTDEFTEEDTRPRYASYAAKKGAGKEVEVEVDGGGGGGPPSAKAAIPIRKSARELRAERRNAENPVGEFTDDEGPRPSGYAEDVVGEDSRVPPGPHYEEDVERFLRVIKSATKSDDPSRNPFASADSGRIPGSNDSSSGVPNIQASRPFQPKYGVQYGAAGKYIEMMQSKGLLPHYTPASPPSASSGDEEVDQSGGYEEEKPVTVKVDGLDAWNSSPLTKVYDSELASGAEPGSRIKDWKGDDYENATGEWTVHPTDGEKDRVITKHLRDVAQVLNFMVRAKMSGIDIGDYDALAAVPRLKWNNLVEAPADAGEAVAEILLNQSGGGICMLAARATALREDLASLGIDIHGMEW